MDKIESLRRGDGAGRRASAMGRRQSLTTTNIQQYQEKQKEKTAKYKADREARKVRILCMYKMGKLTLHNNLLSYEMWHTGFKSCLG